MSTATASRLTRPVFAVLALCSAAAVPVWLAGNRHPEPVRPAAATVPMVVAAEPIHDLAAMLGRSRSAADARNQAALTLCTAEITAVLDRQFTDLSFRAEATAAEVATYKNCVKLIAMLASDQVRGRTDAQAWVRARVEAGIGPQVTACQREVQAVLDRLDRELAASTLTLATEMAAIGATASVASVPDYARGLDGLSLDAALGKLGFDGALVSPAIVLDVYALLHTRIVRWLIKQVVEMAGWIFARPLAAAVTEAGLVVADGPLPIGDAIATLGAVWTAYDIYALRNHFEKELIAAVRQSLSEARQSMEQQIWAVLRERVASHAEIQARIHDDTTRDLQP
jgi:hypothetical protein